MHYTHKENKMEKFEYRLNWFCSNDGELSGIVCTFNDEDGSYRWVENPTYKYIIHEGRVLFCDENRTTRMDDIGEFVDLYEA